MAYGVVHQFAGGTKEQYEASIAAVHPSDGAWPRVRCPSRGPVGRRMDDRRDP